MKTWGKEQNVRIIETQTTCFDSYSKGSFRFGFIQPNKVIRTTIDYPSLTN